MIGRAAFYRNYCDKYHLVEQIFGAVAVLGWPPDSWWGQRTVAWQRASAGDRPACAAEVSRRNPRPDDQPAIRTAPPPRPRTPKGTAQ
jgi:hypothetical protein